MYSCREVVPAFWAPIPRNASRIVVMAPAYQRTRITTSSAASAARGYARRSLLADAGQRQPQRPRTGIHDGRESDAAVVARIVDADRLGADPLESPALEHRPRARPATSAACGRPGRSCAAPSRGGGRRGGRRARAPADGEVHRAARDRAGLQHAATSTSACSPRRAARPARPRRGRTRRPPRRRLGVEVDDPHASRTQRRQHLLARCAAARPSGSAASTSRCRARGRQRRARSPPARPCPGRRLDMHAVTLRFGTARHVA